MRLRVPARRLGGDVPLTELGHGESRLVEKGKAGKERQSPVGTPYWRAGNRRHTHQDNQGDGSEGTDDRAMGRTSGATRDGEAAREQRGGGQHHPKGRRRRGASVPESERAPTHTGQEVSVQPHREEMGENASLSLPGPDCLLQKHRPREPAGTVHPGRPPGHNAGRRRAEREPAQTR